MLSVARLRHFRSLSRHYRNWPELVFQEVLGREPNRAQLRRGPCVHGSSGDLLGVIGEIFLTGVYQPPGFEIAEDDVIVDIGANIGVFSLYAGTRTKQQVYAYEPCPENFKLLQSNLAANSVHNVRAINRAVSDREGPVALYLADSAAGHLLFDHNSDGRLHESITVSATTLPALLEQHGLHRVDLLKLDCEGSEGAILSSTPPDVLRRVRRIALEFHDNVSEPGHSGIADLLEKHGFETRVRWDGRSPFGYLYAAQPKGSV